MINKVNNLDWNIGIKSVDYKSVDCLIADVPYGMDYQSNARKEKHDKIEGDDNLDWLPEWCFQIKRVMKSDAHMYVFCSWHKVEVFKNELRKHFNIKNILIWNKGGGGMGDLEGDYSPQYYMIIYCSNGKKPLNGKRTGSVIETPKTLNENHPTEKPVALIRYLVEKSTEKGDLVLDTFAGSFSTLQACKQTGRNCISFEIKKKHCDKAKNLVDGITIDMFS